MIYLGVLILCAIPPVTLSPQDALRRKGANKKKFHLTQGD